MSPDGSGPSVGFARAIGDPPFVRAIAVVRKRRRILPPAADNFLAALVELVFRLLCPTLVGR